MKTEISAGGVVVRPKGRTWQVLLMKDMNGSWTFPKGLIEKSENPPAAAQREIKEEVGLDELQLIKALKSIDYWYRRNGLIRKTVHYFLFQLKGNPKISVQKEEGISDARWTAFPKALDIVGYPKTNIALLKEAKSALTNL